jgi:ribosome-associated protein
LEKVKLALKTALDKKAEEPVVIDLRGFSSLADFFLILTASSDTHARTVADEIRRRFKERGILPVSLEGYDNANWILIDFGDLIVHIFKPEFRELYNLESLWLDAPKLEAAQVLPEEVNNEV